MEQKLKEGDTVKLKSGGPPMTVYLSEPSGEVTCTWFLQGEVRTARFHEDQLVRVVTGN